MDKKDPFRSILTTIFSNILQKNGSIIRLLDMNIYRPWGDDSTKFYKGRILCNEISSFRPSLIGIGCLFSGQFPSVLEILEPIKKEMPGAEVNDQAMKDGLFMDAIDAANLWRTTGLQYTDNKHFLIRP